MQHYAEAVHVAFIRAARWRFVAEEQQLWRRPEKLRVIAFVFGAMDLVYLGQCLKAKEADLDRPSTVNLTRVAL